MSQNSLNGLRFFADLQRKEKQRELQNEVRFYYLKDFWSILGYKKSFQPEYLLERMDTMTKLRLVALQNDSGVVFQKEDVDFAKVYSNKVMAPSFKWFMVGGVLFSYFDRVLRVDSVYGLTFRPTFLKGTIKFLLLPSAYRVFSLRKFKRENAEKKELIEKKYNINDNPDFQDSLERSLASV